jgi:hypothetical protein
LLQPSYGIFAFFNSSAGTVGGIHNFAGNAFAHGSFTTQAGVVYQPADTKSGFAVSTYFYRNLVVCATYAAGTYFEERHNIFHSRVKYFKGIFAGFSTDKIKSIIYNAFCNAFFAIKHDFVDESG